MPQQSVHVRLQSELLDALDKFRRGQPDLPSKPEALRRALQAVTARQDGREANDDGRPAA